MSDYPWIAKQFERSRAKARLLPRRAKHGVGVLFSPSLAKVAFILAIMMVAAMAFYGYFRLGIRDDGVDLEYAARFGILTFAFIFSLPILGRAVSFSKRHRREANEMLNDHWYFPLHFCLAILFMYGLLQGTLYALPYLYAAWNALTHAANVPDTFTPLELYQRWLGYAMLLTVAYETGLLINPWWQSRKQKARHITHSPFGLLLGKSTGLLEKRSHGAGLKGGQDIVLSLEDATHNMVVLGGIGSGKTTCVINPVLLQLFQQDCGGLIFDIKGDFHSTVYKFSENLISKERLVRLGMGGHPINLIEGLSPEMAASFLKSALILGGQGRGESFWIDTATELCRNALGVLSLLPEKYTLTDLYDYLFHANAKARLQDEIESIIPALDDSKLRTLNSYQGYMEHVFDTFEDKTKANVMATVAQVLSPFRNPALVDAFCKSSPLKMENVLNGAVYLLSLPLAEWGLGGKVAYNFIKLRFFNVMQKRLTQPQWNQNRPVFFLCDEYQEIASGNKDSLSDLNFWDKSRTSKTIGIISAQSMSSFYAAIGDRDVANTILQNFRQKICFRTEDQTTFDYLNRLIGQVEVEKKTTSTQRGSSSKNLGDGRQVHHSQSESTAYVDKPVVDAQLLRNLLPAQAVAALVIQGHSCDDVLNMTALL